MKELLLKFMRQWDIDENLIYKKAGIDQAIYVRDTLAMNLLRSVPAFAISMHRSKSVPLPVYGLTMRNGIKLIMRDNFYDWKVSVILPKPLPKNYLPMELISNDGDIPDCYLEGFHNEWGFETYKPEDEKQNKFTIEVYGKYRLYTLLFYLKNAFPEKEFNPEDDKRTVEEIKESIDKIHEEAGFNIWREDDTIGGKPYKRRLMSGFEILWRTYNAIDDFKNDEVKDYDSKYKYFENKYWNSHPHEDNARFLILDVPNDTALFAKIIHDEPTVHKVFLMEEWLYNQKY